MTTNEWVSIEDEPMPTNQHVWVHLRTGKVEMGILLYDWGIVTFSGWSVSLSAVAHWMGISKPKPPE